MSRFSHKTVEQLKAENPEIEMGSEEWVARRVKEYLDKPWKQISEKDYNWGMNSMPPIKDIGSCFANPELLIDGVYMHYVKLIKGNEILFFKAPRLMITSWLDLIKEVKNNQ